MNNQSSGVYVIDSEYNIINVNDTAKKVYPTLKVGEKCYKCLMGLDEPCGPCPVVNGVKGPTTYTDPIRHISEVVDAVDVNVEGYGECHALVFATVEEEAKFAATLPASAEDLRNLSLVKALTVDYYDVFSVNLNDGVMTLYRHNGKALGPDSIYKQITSYEQGIEDYIKHHVIPEDQEMLREKSSISYLKEALKKSEFIMIHYRVFWNNEIHYFFRKISRIGDADNFDTVVIGIVCEDETIKSQELQMTLQKNLKKVEYSAETGLLTKEAFFVHGNRLLKDNPDKEYDFCILRIDNLTPINHQYGRIAGNKIIQLIGELLKNYENETSCIAYFGSGTFGSLTVGQSTESRKTSVFKFRDDILNSSEIKNISLKWSIYKAIDRNLSVEEVYEKVSYAVTANHDAKFQEYTEFDQEMLEQLDWDNYVENNFKKALADGEFVAWYQPKYDVHSQKIAGAEALVRWVRPNGEIIPPIKFIPVLENCGLIKLLDEEIFRQACEMQKTLTERGLHRIPISVNLSRASIFINDISENYSRIAESYNVEPKWIPIEITESAAVRALRIKEFAASLIEKGFALHMDDFGSGYSSLVSLQVIPFENIKLDKSIVDFIGKANGEAILKHTIAFAKESGMTVTAEGVETLEQYIFLKYAGCDTIQGYYFCEPITAEKLLKELSK